VGTEAKGQFSAKFVSLGFLVAWVGKWTSYRAGRAIQLVEGGSTEATFRCSSQLGSCGEVANLERFSDSGKLGGKTGKYRDVGRTPNTVEGVSLGGGGGGRPQKFRAI